VPLRHQRRLLARWLHLPRRTIRLRLAVLYGGLFFISGAVMLTLTYAAAARTHVGYTQVVAIHVGHSSSAAPPGVLQPIPALPHGRQLGPPGSARSGATVKVVDPGQRSADLRVLAVVSVIVLALMAAISMGLGWLIAGRVLRPLRTITGTAREISATNLHRRLALDGPDDEFKELGDTFDGLLARLDSSFQSQRQFVANASHELRTPLARLKTLAQVALADPHASVESLRASHQRVLASEQQLEELIEALLTLARSERGLERREAVNLATVTAEVLAARGAEIAERGLHLHATLDVAGVEGNPQLIERLVVNLIDNAIRHNHGGGRVEVTTGVGAAGVVLSLANDGPIISPQELERIQQPFQRLGAERASRGDGHGLGLSIAHAIADAHGATLSVQANPDGGLHVTVSFVPV
jgi:signal transduction histidine kinase